MFQRILLIVLVGSLLSGCSNIQDFFAEKLLGSKSSSSKLAAGDEGVYRSKLVQATDADKDGITDGRDECANTPAGVMVDSFGCPVQLYLQVSLQYGRFQPNQQNMADVDRIGRLLVNNPMAHAVVEGHTDNQGNPQDNLQESQIRAEQLKEMIVKKYHVSPHRIASQGYGDARPMVSNATELGRLRNRRIEVTLKGYYRQEVQYVALGKPMNLHFATGQSSAAGLNDQQLRRIANMLQENPQAMVAIDGHTDNVGNPNFNLALSQKRAESVKTYLIRTYKIDASQLQARGYGEENPIADNGTENGRFLNRRVTLTLKTPAKARQAHRLTAKRIDLTPLNY